MKALLLIDVQKGLDESYWGARNNPHAETNIELLLNAWRSKSLPVIHVHHDSTNPKSPLRPGYAGNDVKEFARPLPDEPLFRKTVNSAFIGTGLEDYLREQGINDLVIVGLTTDHCISTSVRMAANLGFSVTLVGDAVATHDRTGFDGTHYSADQMHEVNLASLHGEFCQVQLAADVRTNITE